MKYSSSEEIREALGLDPWEVYEARRIAETKCMTPRGIGRTTKMLVEALFQSQVEVVQIVGYRHWYSEYLVELAWDMCNILGLDKKQIEVYQVNTGRRVFNDHYKEQADE